MSNAALTEALRRQRRLSLLHVEANAIAAALIDEAHAVRLRIGEIETALSRAVANHAAELGDDGRLYRVRYRRPADAASAMAQLEAVRELVPSSEIPGGDRILAELRDLRRRKEEIAGEQAKLRPRMVVGRLAEACRDALERRGAFGGQLARAFDVPRPAAAP